MLLSSLSGLFCGYGLWESMGKLLYFWPDLGSWMLYPGMILILLAGFSDIRWLPATVFLEMAVILDWGKFLYEKPVLPQGVFILCYLAAAVYAACLWGRKRKELHEEKE